jgi:hypothetical protein
MGGVASPFSGGFVPPGAPGSPEAGGPPGGQPPQPPQPEPNVDALMGGGQQLPAPDPQEHLRAIMRRYREAEQLIDGLAAASGPETAPMARIIKEALRKMMSTAVARPGAVPEPAAPRTLG